MVVLTTTDSNILVKRLVGGGKQPIVLKLSACYEMQGVVQNVI